MSDPIPWEGRKRYLDAAALPLPCDLGCGVQVTATGNIGVFVRDVARDYVVCNRHAAEITAANPSAIVRQVYDPTPPPDQAA